MGSTERLTSKRWKILLPIAGLLALAVMYIVVYQAGWSWDDGQTSSWSDEELENNAELKPKVELEFGHGPVAHENLRVEGNEKGGGNGNGNWSGNETRTGG
ncbi:hypothetical protein Slin15195_G003260 [Septoria linicola]|uniref:Uncharacterized protein n=1 Tax=Septoria linicola TaxID=215465 RepID=A0A9Q9AJ24_9PEZI|nr:hypothetical protein Slin14017_G003290 [Septoria linicola]USW47007.1 hypothetical protein Slin15195_G003260 [Septoria linicola]